MEFTEEKKKEIEKAIVDACISALEGNRMQESDMGDVSFFVLERIDSVKTQAEMFDFLEKLAARWNIFSSILEIESGRADMVHDKQAAKDAEELIKNGDIENAIKIAKAANEGGI